jgi:acyl-CoA synthetase (AMP-forming)/AMP-acid ligase II
MLCLVASQIHALHGMRYGAGESLPELKVVNFAGAPFPVCRVDTIRSLFPNARVLNNYGCTEGLPRLTVMEVEDSHPDVTNVGRAIPGVSLRVAGSSMGPIEFQAPSALIGTVNPDGSIHMHPEWIGSGDSGVLDGDELHVLGRHDQIFKGAGERFSLLELEQSFLALAGIDNVMAMIPGESRLDSLAPIVVINGSAIPEELQVTILLKSNLPMHAWPLSVFWVDGWLHTAAGKTDRSALSQQAVAGALKRVWKSPLER